MRCPLSNDLDGLIEITVEMTFKDFTVVEGNIKKIKQQIKS